MTKPTSKVIQILKDNYSSDERTTLTVLCEDGSIWSRYLLEWECELEPCSYKPSRTTEEELAEERKGAIEDIRN